MPSFRYELLCEGRVAGIDEAGRGPLAGPVVAAVAVIDRTAAKRRLLKLINDSKQLVVEDREARGLTVKSTFVGIRELNLTKAEFNAATAEAEVTVRFIGEITSSTRDKAGQVVDGDPNEIKRQKDIWTFARKMGVDNPNWQLVATGE